MVEIVLSAAQHVARREAERQLIKGQAFSEHFSRIFDIVEFVAKRFASGRKLNRKLFLELVGEIQGIVKAFGVLHCEEASRDPSRIHPNGARWETLFLSRSSNGTVHGSVQGFYGTRIYLTQKKLSIDFDYAGLDVSRHLLERAIQRDLTAWTGEYRDLENTLVEAVGLVCVWRRARRLGLVPLDEIAVPYGRGLLLGRFEAMDRGYEANSVELARDSFRQALLPVGVFHENAEGRAFRCAFATTVSEEMTTWKQDCMREELQAFSLRHIEPLTRIRRLAIWRPTQLLPYADMAQTEKDLDALAVELGQILAMPDVRGGLVRRDAPKQTNSEACGGEPSEDMEPVTMS